MKNSKFVIFLSCLFAATLTAPLVTAAGHGGGRGSGGHSFAGRPGMGMVGRPGMGMPGRPGMGMRSDFDRDDRFRRFNRFNDFDRDDRFRRFNRFNDFDRDDRFRRFHHHHNFNDIIVFDNFGFPFFPPFFPFFPPF
jgi:hypothetical protein